jgi:hypothetical protein
MFEDASRREFARQRAENDLSQTDIAVAENAVWEKVQTLLKQHIPSITDEDESEMDFAMVKSIGEGYDYADFALRTCMCGKKIEGFYEYNDHLAEVFRGA